MSQKNMELARAYYEAVAKKDDQAIERRLHPSVTFLSPVAELNGMEEVFSWVKRFLQNLDSLTIRSVCANEDQGMVAYDVRFPGSKSPVRGAALLDFKDGLIKRIELFFDRSES